MKSYSLTLTILTAIVAFGTVVSAAPVSSLYRSLIPEVTDTYYIGTSTPSTVEYNGIYTRNLTVSGTCIGCGGGGGSGTVGTSTNEIQGYLSYWTTTSGTPATLGQVATSTLTVSGPFTYPTIRIIGASGAVTYTGLATTSQPSSSNLLTSNGAAGVYGTATSTLSASSPLTGSLTQVGSGGSLGLQAASASLNGYLSFTDYQLLHAATTTFSSPLIYTLSTNAVTCSTCLTALAGAALAKGNFLVGNDAGLAQATSSIFISSTGLIGIGSTTPGSLLSIGGSGTGWNFYDNATTTSNAKGINLTNGGCFAVSGTCVGGSSATPSTPVNSLQYNNNTAFGGATGFTFGSTTDRLTASATSSVLLTGTDSVPVLYFKATTGTAPALRYVGDQLEVVNASLADFGVIKAKTFVANQLIKFQNMGTIRAQFDGYAEFLNNAASAYGGVYASQVRLVPTSGLTDTVALGYNAVGVAEINSTTAGTLRDLTMRSASTTGQTVLATGSGFVGVGTSTPTRLLDIFSTGTTTLRVDSNSTTKGSCLTLKDSDGVGYTYVTVSNGVLTASAISCE